MKRAKYGAKKTRDLKPNFTPHFHVNPKRRKIPEKSGVPSRDREVFCGKERNSHALKSEDPGQSE